MLTKYDLKMPHAVFSGEDALDKIRDIFVGNGVKRLAVFSDKGIEGAGLLDPPMARVKETSVEYAILDDLPAEPTYMEAQKLVDQCKEYGADFIMAVGGGSVQDTAKLASILMTDEYGIKELLDTPGRAKKCIKTLMIPTTAGTGSEATPNAIVAVPEKQLKVGIVNTNMIADYVILDAVMIKKLPRRIAAATGVDALAHAIECWTSNKANPFSDLFAMQALDMILNNIERACDDPEAMDAKNKMQIASFYAGVAITVSGTTAVHALSYPLGGKYHIAHGVSNAILLAPVMRFNEPACRERLAEAYDRCLRGGAKTVEENKYTMMLAHEDLRMVHVSTHVSLREACDRVKKDRVLDVIRIANEGCKAIGIKEPKIAVAGLNPHCGENGMFGTEEVEEIQPAIDQALAEGINIVEKKPIPPDTVFSKALGGWYDIVVVMYHDQGHIPLKVKGFVYNKVEGHWDAVAGVNVTLGLPIIRSSVDHGTGFGHAGDGHANELSLVNAMDYGIRMANAKAEQ